MSKEISSNWYSWLKGQYKFIYTTNRFNSSTKTAITEIHLAECICYDWIEKLIQTFTAGLDEVLKKSPAVFLFNDDLTEKGITWTIMKRYKETIHMTNQ